MYDRSPASRLSHQSGQMIVIHWPELHPGAFCTFNRCLHLFGNNHPGAGARITKHSMVLNEPKVEDGGVDKLVVPDRFLLVEDFGAIRQVQDIVSSLLAILIDYHGVQPLYDVVFGSVSVDNGFQFG